MKRDQVVVPFDPWDEPQVAQLRVPPNSIEAESSVLGALLVDAGAWDRVGDMLADGDFYRHEHRLIYAAIAQLAHACRPVDVVTVYDQLQARGNGEEVGGLAYLNSLAQFVPSAAGIKRHAEIVRERAILRRLVATADEIATKAFNTEGRSVEAIVDEAQAAVMAVAEAGASAEDDWQDLESGVTQALDRINDLALNPSQHDFIPTGIAGIDDRLDGGMRPGELIVVGARPSMGKSAMLLTIGVNVAASHGPVGIFSMEMPRAQWHTRAMAQAGRVHLSKIKRPERLRDTDWPGITEAVEKLRGLGLDINDKAGLTINAVRSKARNLRRRRGKLAMLGVDYLGLMRGLDPKMPRAYQIEEITQGLKNLAKELHCPVVLLVQLKRAVEERADQMPTLSDLRDSGAIEQDADVITFIHRPWKAAPDLSDEWKPYARGYVAKVRDGEPGYFDMEFEGQFQRFADWPTDQDVPSSKVRVAKAGRGGGL